MVGAAGIRPLHNFQFLVGLRGTRRPGIRSRQRTAAEQLTNYCLAQIAERGFPTGKEFPTVREFPIILEGNFLLEGGGGNYVVVSCYSKKVIIKPLSGPELCRGVLFHVLLGWDSVCLISLHPLEAPSIRRSFAGKGKLPPAVKC